MESPDSANCSRRRFVRVAALSVAALAANPAWTQTLQRMTAPSANAPLLPRRPFGKHGVELSIIGMGGIVVMNAEQAHADRIVAEFVERGVNYFDVAPSYGNAEERLGPALVPHRPRVFLACKTTQRSRAGAATTSVGGSTRRGLATGRAGA